MRDLGPRAVSVWLIDISRVGSLRSVRKIIPVEPPRPRIQVGDEFMHELIRTEGGGLCQCVPSAEVVSSGRMADSDTSGCAPSVPK